MKNTLILISMAILAGFFFHSCCSIWGAHDLGNKLILLEGDKTEDRAIVYCTTQKGCCRGGMYVIPSVGNQYHMYVETAKSNRNWVIAKTVQIKDKKENYWIINKNFDITNLNCDKINCDSIIQSHIIGPLNFIDFEKKVKGLNIDLSLK